MAQPAKVTAIEALDAFKASLIVYLEKVGCVLDDVSQDVIRTRIWLEADRRLHWNNQVRQKNKELAQAEQELMTARLSGLPEAIKVRRMAVNKAKTALRDAEDRLGRVKQWLRQYETHVESRAKVVMKLRYSMTHDLGKAVAFLESAATSLAAYAQMSPPAPSTSRIGTNHSGTADPEGETSERSAPGGIE